MKSSMKKYCKALVNLALALVAALLVIFLLPRLLLYFAPFVAGWIIALIASPLVRFFEEKVKIKRKAGSAVVIVVVIGLVVLAIYLIGVQLVEQIAGFIKALPEMWQGLETEFAEIGRNLGVFFERFPVEIQDSINEMAQQAGSYLGDLVGKISSPTITAVGNFAKQLPSLLIGIIMALLSSYFFVADRNTLAGWFHRYFPKFIHTRFALLKKSLGKAVGGYFKAQLKIEIWMYILLVIGLSILKVNYTLLIALGIAILDFLPFFGTGTVMVPWAIIKILSGDYTMAIGLLIIWGVGQLARQVIQPKIVGDSIGVPPIPTLFLLFLGYKLGGVFGMILAVPLGLIIYTMYEEGAFDTTKNSVLLLIAGINRFRRLSKADMQVIEEMKNEAEDKAENKAADKAENESAEKAAEKTENKAENKKGAKGE